MSLAVAAAAQPKPVDKMDRRELAQELISLERKHGRVFARIDDLKSALRKLATAANQNFKEEFAGKGVVKVSAGHAGEFKGILPEVNHERFLALPEKKRAELTNEDTGIINMTAKHSKPYYGSVTVELF